MSDDLIVFLRDRLDEDELMADEADGSLGRVQGTWSVRAEQSGFAMILAKSFYTVVSNVVPETAQHMARHDPDRIKAEVTSKRAILAWHSTPHTVVTEATTYAEVGFCYECDGQCTHKGEAVCECCGYPDGCTTVRQLATVYADHRDYREEWKP